MRWQCEVVLIVAMLLITTRHLPAPIRSVTESSPTATPPIAEAAPSITPSPYATNTPGANAQPAPQSKEGGLWISTDPAGATVIIDGSITKISPATLSTLPTGQHHLQIVLEGYYSEERDVEVKAGELAFIGKITLRGRSDQFDGKWIGHDRRWTGILTVDGGTMARITMEASEKLSPKATRWSNIPVPYDTARTLSFEWSTDSNSVRVNGTAIAFNWNEWKLKWEPSGIPYSLLTKIFHRPPPAGGFSIAVPPARDWAFTLKGSELVSGKWTFHRKR